MIRKQKLELTWIGKEERPRLGLALAAGLPDDNF